MNQMERGNKQDTILFKDVIWMIGKRIKILRDERRMSQEELAKAIGCSRVSITNYEAGKRVLDVNIAMNAADFFGVTVDYLTGRTEYRYKDDIEVSLEKAVEMEIPSDTLYVLCNCCIQMRGLLYEYEKMQKSIVLPIVELKRRKVPESQIRLTVQDKPRAVYDKAFDMADTVADTVKSCAKAMVVELDKLVEEALGE